MCKIHSVPSCNQRQRHKKRCNNRQHFHNFILPDIDLRLMHFSKLHGILFECLHHVIQSSCLLTEKPKKQTEKKERVFNGRKKLKFSFKEQREYETIDEEIAKLEEKIASLDRQIAANATNSVKLRELMEEQEKVRGQLEEKEERWMYLNELAEEFGL